MPIRLLVAVAALACAMPSFAAKANKARAAECRQLCGTAIQACIDAGGRPRKCTRSVRKRCRKEGIEVCVPPVLPENAYIVASTGADVAGCGTREAPCATIQFTIDTLVPRGTTAAIKVAVGTYDQQTPCDAGGGADRAVVCVVDKQVTLLGGFTPPNWDTSSNDPSATVIDAKGQGRGVVAVRSSPAQVAALEMDGFTIRNGTAQGKASGDGFYTMAFGGGMLTGNCAINLRRMAFRNNVSIGGGTDQPQGASGAGGALAMNGNQGSSPPSATLANVTFQANQARGGDGVEAGGYALGGGMFAFGYAVSGDGLVFTDNAATAGSSDGDGLFGTHKADALGGAVAASVDSIFDLRHVQASGNVATGGDAPNGDGGCAYGGALFAELATFALSDATIVGNRAAGGDGRNAGGPSSFAQGGGVMATLTRFTLDRVTVRGNEARAGDGSVHGGLPEGGAVAVTVGARDGVELPFTIRNSVLANNLVSVGSGRLAGGGGGALWIQGASGTVEHVTIADNRLGEPHLLGGGVGILPLAGVQTRVAFVNDIFANHRSPAPNPSLHTNAALWVAQDAVADVTHALFANNIHDTNAGIWDPNYVPAGTINLIDIHTAANAGFVSAGDPQNDYHLLGTSPAVDRASAGAVTIDLDGTLRPAGLAPDLGAYELTP